MASASFLPPPETLHWLSAGEPPTGIAERQTARMKRGLPYFSIGGGLLVGGFAGFAGVVLVYGGSWPLPSSWGLFFAIAVPVGVASFFTTRTMVPWIGRASTMHVRRVAVSTGELHVEDMSGHLAVIPLARVSVAETPTEEGWLAVTIQGGRVAPFFYVPRFVGSTIASALSGSA